MRRHEAQRSGARRPTHLQRRPCLPGGHPIKEHKDAAPQGACILEAPRCLRILSGGPLLLAKAGTRAPALTEHTLMPSRIMESSYRRRSSK